MLRNVVFNFVTIFASIYLGFLSASSQDPLCLFACLWSTTDYMHRCFDGYVLYNIHKSKNAYNKTI